MCEDSFSTVGVGAASFTLSLADYLKCKAIFPALWTQDTNPRRILREEILWEDVIYYNFRANGAIPLHYSSWALHPLSSTSLLLISCCVVNVFVYLPGYLLTIIKTGQPFDILICYYHLQMLWATFIALLGYTWPMGYRSDMVIKGSDVNTCDLDLVWSGIY